MLWDGALPEPVLADSRATYRDVLAGVDLVVEATPSGFEQFVVVKDRPAAARVATLRLPLKSRSLRFVNDAPGAFAITDRSGASVGRVPTPMAWDAAPLGAGTAREDRPLSVAVRSPKAKVARPATATGVSAGTARAGVADAAEGTGEVTLEVSADPAWLTDPARTFPVTLDPAIRIGPVGDTYVKEGDTVDRSGYNDLQLGHGKESSGKEWNTRSLLQWDTARFAGAKVRSATLNLWNFYSRWCAAAQWDLYNVAPFSLPVYWSNMPAFDARALSSSTETKGYDASCDDGRVKIVATAFFQKAADAGAGSAYMGLKATDETTTAGYKSFRSSQGVASEVPYLDIDFEAAPLVSNLSTNPATAFGRTTVLPGGLANTFYADDLVAAQQTADTKRDWTLDPANRLRAFTTATLANGAWVNASSKLNHYGDDSDRPRWIVEGAGTEGITRNVSGPDSDLVATTSASGAVRLQLTNLHGEVASIDTALTTPEFYSFDEFGVPTSGQAPQRYGWLGGKQRSADALGGVILMGVRLYSPALGRFLQVDPVVGGSATAYDYCNADPANCVDLDGRKGKGRGKGKEHKGPQMSAAEKAALAKQKAGQPLSDAERKLAASAKRKEQAQQKIDAGTRNKQKRKSHYGGTAKRIGKVLLWGVVAVAVVFLIIALLPFLVIGGLAFA